MEPANEVQEVEQLQFPLVIAMKDVSGSNNQCSKIAQKLASFLKFPLIDQNDVTQAILNSTKTQIPNELAHSLPFEVVCQIASTQLNLKIKVVINSPISNDDHLDRLVQLARSREAHLIIIKCNSKDDYDVGKIPKLNIDTKSFDVRKVVSDLYIMLSHMEKDEVSKETIIMRNGQLRFFLTSKSSPYYDPSKHPCDICKEFIEKGQLFYHCKVPKLKIHHKCMIRDEHRVDVLIKQKNSTQETGLPANLFGESFIEDILKSLPGVIPEDVDLLLKKHGKRERNFVG
ncbi:conserved hypothetical protein [Ricinus communis]|uniref:Uncharacterized protein n=1 Tax=Ricinus communis TaxID=3988 RepID=B9SWE1_RICCO|nr:conserved hypothetical protein [Ricinus communis]